MRDDQVGGEGRKEVGWDLGERRQMEEKQGRCHSGGRTSGRGRDAWHRGVREGKGGGGIDARESEEKRGGGRNRDANMTFPRPRCSARGSPQVHSVTRKVHTVTDEFA